MSKQLFFLIPCFLLIFSTASGQLPSYMFAHGFGDNSQDQGTAVTTDASGNSYITGNFSGVVDFDPSPGTATLASAGFSDIFVAKYNSSGQYQWAIGMGGATVYDSGNSIVADGSGNIYVTGYFGDVADFDPSPSNATLSAAGNGDVDAFVAKYNTNGQFLWAVNFQGPGNASGISIALSPANTIITAGKFQLSADFDGSTSTATLNSAGSEDIFVTTYSSTGNFISAFNVGGMGDDHCNGVSVDAAGNIIITGGFDQSADFDPSAGTTMLLPTPGLNGQDIFLAKYNSSNAIQWAINLGSQGNDEGYALTADAAGNSYVTGFFSNVAAFDPSSSTSNTLAASGANDVFIAKYNPNGNYMWAVSLGGSGNDNARSISTDASGFLYVTGNFENTADLDPSSSSYTVASAGLSDIFISKYNNSGQFIWGFNAGGTGADLGFGIITNSTGGDIYCAGIYQNTVDFDPSASTVNLTFNGVEDAFIAKYKDLTVNVAEYISDDIPGIFPNPFVNETQVQLRESSEIELYDVYGQLLLRKTMNTGLNQIKMENYPAGIYVLKINPGKNEITRKLIKNN